MRIWVFLIGLFPVLSFAQFQFETGSELSSKWRNSPQQYSYGFEWNQIYRNTEYFGSTAKGFTAFSNLLEPYFAYQHSSILYNHTIRLEFGAAVQYFSGAEQRFDFFPNMQFRWKWNAISGLHIGRINGGIQHRLSEQLYSFDRQYQVPVENGIQFFSYGKEKFTDAWVHWSNFIQPADTFQEEFTAGFSHQSDWLKQHQFLDFQPVVQGYFYHRGGQIDASDLSILSTLNAAVGAHLEVKWKTNQFIGDDRNYKAGVKYLFHTYQKLSGPDEGPNYIAYNDGYGNYAVATFSSPLLYTEIGYWYANEFWSPLGESLLHSIPSRNTAIGLEEREYYIAKFNLKHRIGKQQPIFLSARFDGYYGLQDQEFEYGIGVGVRAFIEKR